MSTTEVAKKAKLNHDDQTLYAMDAAEVMSMLPKGMSSIIVMGSVLEKYLTVLLAQHLTLKQVYVIEPDSELVAKYRHEFPLDRFPQLDIIHSSTSNYTPPSLVDMVLCNWHLMYHNDKENKELLIRALDWLKPTGYFMFRESCFNRSGLDTNDGTKEPTYRHPSLYVGLIASTFIKKDSSILCFFELVSSKSIAAYRHLKQNNGQLVFIYRKTSQESQTIESFQQFLDQQQYSISSIARYEKIFGSGYVSTGGQATTTEFVQLLNLKRHQRVLDVGCGIGGGDFYMAQKYDVSVVGIDLSTNMVHVALERSMHNEAYRELDVEFEICDATKKEYEGASFDVVYSRDTILHIQDKLGLFQRFFKFLKPGGQILISDYCCSDASKEPHSAPFQAYVQSRGYHLLSPEGYGKVLTEAGFECVQAQDRTEQFIEVLKQELEQTEQDKDDFIRETSETDYNDIVSGWKSKLERCAAGDQRWGLFLATKPTTTTAIEK